MHPDIQFAPLIPPLASLFLHFMEEDLCYACLSAVVNSRRSMLDQSWRATVVMAKTFQDSFKSYFVSSSFRLCYLIIELHIVGQIHSVFKF